MGRVQRLSHGQYRRERRPALADHPRAAGRVRRRVANKAEAAQKTGRFKDEIVPVTIKSRKGDTVVDKDETSEHGATSRRWPGCARPSTRMARSPPEMPRESMTAPLRSC